MRRRSSNCDNGSGGRRCDVVLVGAAEASVLRLSGVGALLPLIVTRLLDGKACSHFPSEDDRCGLIDVQR